MYGSAWRWGEVVVEGKEDESRLPPRARLQPRVSTLDPALRGSEPPHDRRPSASTNRPSSCLFQPGTHLLRIRAHESLQGGLRQRAVAFHKRVYIYSPHAARRVHPRIRYPVLGIDDVCTSARHVPTSTNGRRARLLSSSPVPCPSWRIVPPCLGQPCNAANVGQCQATPGG